MMPTNSSEPDDEGSTDPPGCDSIETAPSA
jgi:hypothetical protein